MSPFVRNPDMCSRCGAIDDRHSMKCYQAMAMGIALGFEEPRAHAIAGFPKPDLSAAGREVAALREQLAKAQEQERHWRERVRTWQHDYALLHEQFENLRAQQTGSAALTNLVTETWTYTELPPGYLDALIAGKQRLAREAEIDAEIASPEFQAELDLQERLIADAEASPDLDVVRHDGAVSIYPKRDDDPPHEDGFTPDGWDRVDDPEDQVEETATQVTKPDRPQPTFDPASNATVVPEQKISAAGNVWKAQKGVPGAWSKPQTIAAEAAVQEFVDTQVVVADAPPRTDGNGRTFDPGYVLASEFVSAFEDWAKENGKPTDKRTPFTLGAALRNKVPTPPKQAPTYPGETPRKPIAYFGLMLASALDELTKPEPAVEPEPERELTKAEINAREVAETRRLMAEAQARARSEQESLAQTVARLDQEAIQEQLADGADPATVLARGGANNGWFLPPKAPTGAAPAVLTVADIKAENAAIMEATSKARPDVVRPGTEKMTPFAREFINALLDLDAGFIYTPAQGGAGGGQGGKGHIKAPDGSRFTVATTFSGQDELRNLRRWLNRNGYLPTAGSPISALTKPGKKGKPAAKASPPVKIIRKDGREETVEQAAARQVDRPPMSEDEMDKTLFQVFSDCRTGLPLTVPYTETADVLGLEGYPKDAIDRAVRDPDRVEVRPESKDKGYPILKFAKGDVVVIMGFRTPKFPAVMRAEWDALLMNDTHRVNHTGSGGSRESTGLPNTPSALRSRLQQMGATITPSESGKTAAVSYQGQALGLMTMEKCPRATVHNDFQRMQRKMHAIDQKQTAAV